MTYIAVFTVILIGAFSVYLVISPFFKSNSAKLLDNIQTDEAEQLDKIPLYATLNELELDYHMGKLSEEDYKNLKWQYESVLSKLIKEERESENQLALEEEEFIRMVNKKRRIMSEMEEDYEKDLEQVEIELKKFVE